MTSAELWGTIASMAVGVPIVMALFLGPFVITLLLLKWISPEFFDYITKPKRDK